jgi:hypothetical protein
VDAPAPLAFWHVASLDAPTVAIVWSSAFAWAVKVHLPAWVPVLLALTTWAVYVGDRLLDARLAFNCRQRHRLRLRHRFHWRHRRILLPMAAAAAIAAACMIFRLMPPRALERNSVLAAATLAYFTGVHVPRPLPGLGPANLGPWLRRFLRSVFTTELLIGTLFTAGCVLPAISCVSRAQFPVLSGLALYFALLAWLNCHAIGRWESRTKRVMRSRVLLPAGVLALTGLGAAWLLVAAHPRPAALLASAAVSALLLALLDRLRSRLTPLALRAAADLVLLAPLALLLG